MKNFIDFFGYENKNIATAYLAENFSKWALWEKRDSLVDGSDTRIDEYPGVYLLAHFDKTPSGYHANYLDKNIIYVGEGGWLRKRWKDFERSAKYGLDGHSGGHSYKNEYGESKWKSLYVAAFPIWFGEDKRTSKEDLNTTYRLLLERYVIWELTVARGGEHKLLNKK